MMKKMTEAALTAGLVAALLLTGCGEKRATDTNDNRPDVVQQGKQAGEDAAKGAKDLLDDGADSAKKMLENEQGMLMAAGSRIQDVIMELGETLGITMPQKMDQASLQEVFGLNPSDIEEYYGEYSSVNTSADHIIGVKVKEGRVDAVRSALEKRKETVVENFKEYLPDQYDKAQAGKIIEKGNYLFLVIAGDSTKGYDREMQRAEQIIDGYFQYPFCLLRRTVAGGFFRRWIK